MAAPSPDPSTSADASRRMGPAGGTVSLTQGAARGAQIVIPAGALATAVTITLHANDPPTGLPQGVVPAGPVVTFGPAGQTFAKPVAITLPTTQIATGMYTRPKGGTWTKVPKAHYDLSRRTMVAAVNHFTQFVSTVDLDPAAPPTTPPPGRAASGYLMKAGPDGTFTCQPACGVTLIEESDAKPEPPAKYFMSKAALTAPECVPDVQPMNYLVGFGEVCNVKSIKVPKSSDAPGPGKCLLRAPIDESGTVIPSVYPLQSITSQDFHSQPGIAGGVAVLILAKSVPDIEPAPLPKADEFPEQRTGLGWLEFYRYSDGAQPTPRRSEWLYAVDSLDGPQDDVFDVLFPTTSPGTLGPIDRGGAIHYTVNGRTVVLGTLFALVEAGRGGVAPITQNYGGIDAARKWAHGFNDCY